MHSHVTIRAAAVALLAVLHHHVAAHRVVSLGQAEILVTLERRGELVHAALRPTVEFIGGARRGCHDVPSLVAPGGVDAALLHPIVRKS